MVASVAVIERGRRIEFSFVDLLRYHGPGSPGGVAIGYKALERALALLSPAQPCERREIAIATAFGGPGARDAFEMVTRAVTGGRFAIEPALARPELGRERERFVFRFTYRGRAVTLVLRDGFVTPEFIDLARTDDRSDEEERRLDALKLELADRVMSAPASAVFDATT